MKKNKGITLIALIITIIILLILVGVSLNLLIKGDLFGSAEKAVEGTNAKVKEQQSAVDELMKELEDAQKSEQPGSDEEETLIHNWKYTDSSRAKIRCTCVKCKAFNDGDSTGRTLYIGQQIGDTEKITASSILENAVSGWMYKWEVAVRQEISFESQEIKWVVLGFADENKDGFNETILLTTETPSTGKKTNLQMDSFSTSTKKSVTPIRSNINNEITNFKNKKIIQTKRIEETNKATIGFGSNNIYNNAVNEVERMCKELYGTVNSCSDLTSRSSNNENTLTEYSIRPVKSITEEIPEAGDILNFTTTTATTV